MSPDEQLLARIADRSVLVAILGLGYVGLPLAAAFARAGVRVLGFETDDAKARSVNEARSYIPDVPDADLARARAAGLLSATTDFARIREADAVLVCVPTPLDRFKKPDMRHIEDASRATGRHMRPGTFVSLESTTYPTTTEEFVKPILEAESGMREGRDFWLCFSPERVDPGNRSFTTATTPKIVGALSDQATRIALALYGLAVERVHAVSSPRVAEMAKILENTYRLVNISLVNELALLAGRMGIDIWEVIEAAKTKPYGFQAFYPGPGIGGHCIPLDPFYLEYIAKGFNFDLTMIDAAGRINNLMPYRMMNKIAYALNRRGKALNGSSILFLGVAYKADIGDARESPALQVMELVAHKGASVRYHDPYVAWAPRGEGECEVWEGVELSEGEVSGADCVVFTTNHSCFDVGWIVERARLVVDMRNAVRGVRIEDGKVFKL